MTTYYFNIITSQFQAIPLKVNVLNSIITSINVVNSTTDILLEDAGNFISLDSRSNISKIVFSIKNITNVVPSIFLFLKIIFYSVETASNKNSVYICKTDTDFVICTGLQIGGGTPDELPPPVVTPVIGVLQASAIDTGLYSISTSYNPINDRNVTTKKYVDFSILAEQTRAIAKENYLLQITNYNKIIKPSFAVKNINGTSDGSFPFDMSDQMISSGYDGWYFNNIISSNFINWTFYSNFEINTSQLSSISFNLYIIPTIESYNIPSISVYTKPSTSSTSLYHDCTTFSIDPTVISTLSSGYYYTFYALTAPPLTPNHTQIPLSIVSTTLGTDEVQTSLNYDILNFNITTVPTAVTTYNFIASQFTIVTSYGNENMIMSNDSIYSFDTRSRLNIIYDYFFTTDSSINPSTGLLNPMSQVEPSVVPFSSELTTCPDVRLPGSVVSKFLYYNAYSQTSFNLDSVSDPYNFVFLNFSSNSACQEVSTVSLSTFKLKKYFNYKIQFSADCLSQNSSMTGMYYIATGSSSNSISNISQSSIYNGINTPYYKVNSMMVIDSADTDIYLSITYLGQNSTGQFSNTNLLIEFN